jgi:Kdo2-lipid IVA lauroyltransferase/acyltransferase
VIRVALCATDPVPHVDARIITRLRPEQPGWCGPSGGPLPAVLHPQFRLLRALLTILLRLLSGLPLGALQRIGSAIGRLAMLVPSGYRHHLVENLTRAGYPARTDRALVVRSAAQAGRGVLELAHVWMRPQAEVLARTKATGWEHVEAARAAGRGIVFLTPHLGCFEVTAQYYANNASAPAPLTVLYRPPRKAWLAPLVEGRRARGNLMLAAADVAGVRRLFRALKRGEAIGLLPDQVPSRGEGVWAPFFGVDAYTMTLPARLARQSGAVLLLAHGERLADGEGWVVHFSTVDEALSEDPVAAAAQLNGALERLIRANPTQYLWGYNRYKKPRGAPERPAKERAS